MLYRPFDVKYCYFDDFFIHRLSNFPSLFPNSESSNLLILTNGSGAKKFGLLASKYPVDFNCLEGGARCFPRFFSGSTQKNDGSLFNFGDSDSTTDANFPFKFAPLNDQDSAFHYAYAVCHHPEYVNKYFYDLLRNSPRIPLLEQTEIINELVLAGRKLIDIHANFETAPTYQSLHISGLGQSEIFQKDIKDLYRVQKMRFGGTRGSEDKTTVIFNEHITIKNIPLEAYEYVVNGKPALEWVMERQCVKVDKDSGIVNDANDYAIETMNNPAYPLELFQRVITVSLETMKIVKSLPPLDLN